MSGAPGSHPRRLGGLHPPISLCQGSLAREDAVVILENSKKSSQEIYYTRRHVCLIEPKPGELMPIAGVFVNFDKEGETVTEKWVSRRSTINELWLWWRWKINALFF